MTADASRTWKELDLLTNVDPALAAGWHPVLAATDLSEQPVRVRLLGGDHWVARLDGQVRTLPAAAVQEHAGLIWLAPDQPVVGLVEVPEVDDPGFASGWLPTLRTSTAAGLVADNFLDVAHFPFVHAATFGSEEDPYVEPYDVVQEDGGFRMTYEHAYRNVEDPGVAAGIRPLVQRRRVTYRFRLPFQLRLRLDHLDSGGATVILFFLQPEDLGVTRIWCRVLRKDLSPDLDAAVAFERAILDEDLALSEQFAVPGLPLNPRAELHTRADASGLALRACLRTMRLRHASGRRVLVELAEVAVADCARQPGDLEGMA